MTYDERQEALLEFCKRPRSTEQIKAEFGIGTQAVYGCVRKLKASEHLRRIDAPGKANGHGVTYQWTGKPYHVTNRKKPQYNKGFTILGVRL